MPKIVVTNDKGLVQQAGAGVNLSSGVAVGLQSVTATGANQAAAALIDITGGSIVSVVSTDNNQGVRLPDLAGSYLSLGQKFVIYNSHSEHTLKVYPFSGQKIIGTVAGGGGGALAADAEVNIAAGFSLECYAVSSSSTGSWLAFEHVRATNA